MEEAAARMSAKKLQRLRKVLRQSAYDRTELTSSDKADRRKSTDRMLFWLVRHISRFRLCAISQRIPPVDIVVHASNCIFRGRREGVRVHPKRSINQIKTLPSA